MCSTSATPRINIIGVPDDLVGRICSTGMLTTSDQQDAVIRGPCLTNPSPDHLALLTPLQPRQNKTSSCQLVTCLKNRDVMKPTQKITHSFAVIRPYVICLPFRDHAVRVRGPPRVPTARNSVPCHCHSDFMSIPLRQEIHCTPFMALLSFFMAMECHGMA